MKKLIEVHAFSNCPVFSCGGNPNDPYYAGYCDALDRVVEWMEKFPAVDAVPVVHGHWTSLTDCSNAGVYCSVCQKKVYKEDYAWANRKNKLRSKFCPNCGALMDLKEE